MASGTIQVELVTPTRKLFSQPAESVTFTGALGEMTVLPQHEAMVAALKPGPLVLRHAGSTETYAVGSGMAQIDEGHVTILADSAERADEIDFARAEKAREAALQAMKEQSFYDETFAETQAALGRATTRLTLGAK